MALTPSGARRRWERHEDGPTGTEILLASLLRAAGVCVYRKSYLRVIFGDAQVTDVPAGASGAALEHPRHAEQLAGVGRQGSGQLVAVGVVGGGGARLDAQLGQDARDVDLDRAHTQEERFGNLLVGFPGCHHA